MRSKNITIRIDKGDKKIIKEASKISSLCCSSFCRQVSLAEARKILRENGRKK